MARRFTRGRGRMGSPRLSAWIGVTAVTSQLGGGGSIAALINSFNAATLATRPFTIVRVRGFFGIRSDQISTDEDYDAALGYAVVTDQASAIGVTAVPTPHTDQSSDMFFVYEALMGRHRTQSAVGFEENALTWMHYDSKAMRKVNDDQDLVVVIESSAISVGTQVHHTARLLIKES